MGPRRWQRAGRRCCRGARPHGASARPGTSSSAPFTHAVRWGLEHRNLDGIRNIGVDELSWKKGHKYLTLVYQIDHGCRRLLHIANASNCGWRAMLQTRARRERWLIWRSHHGQADQYGRRSRRGKSERSREVQVRRGGSTMSDASAALRLGRRPAPVSHSPSRARKALVRKPCGRMRRDWREIGAQHVGAASLRPGFA